MITKEIQKKTLQLNPTDKIHLVEIILESLDEPDAKIEKKWITESEARYNAYKSGKVRGISFEEVKRRIKKWK